jgi:hypothetical protein
MSTQLWVSTAADPDRSKLGDEWSPAGELAEGRESDLWRVVQGYLGLRSPSRLRKVQFYADLDPATAGYQQLLQLDPELAGPRTAAPGAAFWLALRWEGPPPGIFFAARQARLAVLQRRPPERHPGLRRPVQPVGMEVVAGPAGMFTKVTE